MAAWYRDLIRLRKEGIADGWLRTSHLSAAYDSELGLFSLRFARVDGRDILVQARLAGVDMRSAEPCSLALTGDLLLSSEPIVAAGKDHVLLQPNHAVITRRIRA